ncbi:alpha-D-ribose 1-methylphosphonate 5-phosphate C-P-lyase PhnJ [Pseudomonas aeruginosa]|nr:alpha-D-ribose 1-methylphosphonate 5-phosphate C-P-lyase PhnJ [Pseudomonas aeruginosa]
MSLSPQASAAPEQGYNFAYLDEQTKRMIRRGLLKACGDPRLPGALRRPRDAAAYGWGTGGRR